MPKNKKNLQRKILNEFEFLSYDDQKNEHARNLLEKISKNNFFLFKEIFTQCRENSITDVINLLQNKWVPDKFSEEEIKIFDHIISPNLAKENLFYTIKYKKYNNFFRLYLGLIAILNNDIKFLNYLLKHEINPNHYILHSLSKELSIKNPLTINMVEFAVIIASQNNEYEEIANHLIKFTHKKYGKIESMNSTVTVWDLIIKAPNNDMVINLFKSGYSLTASVLTNSLTPEGFKEEIHDISIYEYMGNKMYFNKILLEELIILHPLKFLNDLTSTEEIIRKIFFSENFEYIQSSLEMAKKIGLVEIKIRKKLSYINLYQETYLQFLFKFLEVASKEKMLISSSNNYIIGPVDKMYKSAYKIIEYLFEEFSPNLFNEFNIACSPQTPIDMFHENQKLVQIYADKCLKFLKLNIKIEKIDEIISSYEKYKYYNILNDFLKTSPNLAENLNYPLYTIKFPNDTIEEYYSKLKILNVILNNINKENLELTKNIDLISRLLRLKADNLALKLFAGILYENGQKNIFPNLRDILKLADKLKISEKETREKFSEIHRRNLSEKEENNLSEIFEIFTLNSLNDASSTSANIGIGYDAFNQMKKLLENYKSEIDKSGNNIILRKNYEDIFEILIAILHTKILEHHRIDLYENYDKIIDIAFKCKIINKGCFANLNNMREIRNISVHRYYENIRVLRSSEIGNNIKKNQTIILEVIDKFMEQNEQDNFKIISMDEKEFHKIDYHNSHINYNFIEKLKSKISKINDLIETNFSVQFIRKKFEEIFDIIKFSIKFIDFNNSQKIDNYYILQNTRNEVTHWLRENSAFEGSYIDKSIIMIKNNLDFVSEISDELDKKEDISKN